MTLDTRLSHHQADASTRAGTSAIVLGALSVVSTGVAGVISFSDLGPSWLRLLVTAGIPFGMLGTPLATQLPGRDPGAVVVGSGLALALVANAALLFTNELENL